MNLKYYLKGLGLGIIVTALILGIHHKLNTSTMSDAEIKKRAAELGMVENTTLIDKNDQSAEELLATIEDNNSENEETTTPEEENINPESNIEDNGDDNEEADDAGSLEEMVSEIEEDVDALVEQTEEQTEEQTVEAQTDVVDDPDKKTTEESVGNAVTITIVSGDSSYSVAKKLVNAGLVLDASDYDSYLCNYGYDRYIRTGTYQIPGGSSNEQIAKMITGK